MTFLPVVLIKKKRDGHELSDDEIRFFIREFAGGAIPDYQMSAFLMAALLKGLSPTEAASLTRAMVDSGERITFPQLPYRPVDKHSTGGIGDKTSLIIAPLVASCGVPVPMMAGRGLGHTGGTLDKLESIPGFRVDLSLKDFVAQVVATHCAIIGQTDQVCPADKRMYALRDVTGTVESLGLICGSILSKKIAEGIQGLVMDVKYGSGAFMKTPAEAETLARWLIDTAAPNGVRTVAYLTNMNQPLGRFIGNAIEVLECESILTGKPALGFSAQAFDDTRELSLLLASEMIHLAGRTTTLEEARALAETKLVNGDAFAAFQTMVAAQQGRWSDFAFPEDLSWRQITAAANGYVAAYDSEQIGYAAVALGAGRRKSEDVINPLSSLICHKKIGDAVQIGEPLFSYTHFRDADSEVAEDFLATCCKISLQKPPVPSLILKKVT